MFRRMDDTPFDELRRLLQQNHGDLEQLEKLLRAMNRRYLDDARAVVDIHRQVLGANSLEARVPTLNTWIMQTMIIRVDPAATGPAIVKYNNDIIYQSSIPTDGHIYEYNMKFIVRQGGVFNVSVGGTPAYLFFGAFGTQAGDYGAIE